MNGDGPLDASGEGDTINSCEPTLVVESATHMPPNIPHNSWGRNASSSRLGKSLISCSYTSTCSMLYQHIGNRLDIVVVTCGQTSDQKAATHGLIVSTCCHLWDELLGTSPFAGIRTAYKYVSGLAGIVRRRATSRASRQPADDGGASRSQGPN